MDSDYQTAPMDDLDYLGQTHKRAYGRKPGKSKRKFWIGIIILVVLAAAGGSAGYIVHRDHANKAKAAAAAKVKSATPKLLPGEQASGDNYVYKNSALALGVTFPKSWSAKLSNDKQEIILTSPETTYLKKNGTTAHGVFTLKLRNGLIPSAIQSTVQSAVAVDNSQVIAYSNPSSDQRQYTNLSFAGPDANDFSFIIITSDTSYSAGQQFGGGVSLDGQSYLFAGGYGTDANDSLTFDAIPKADYNSSILQQAETILESIQLF